jgi:hypothetical protein
MDTYHLGLLTVRTVAVLWDEFTTELRYHFEHEKPLPRMYGSDTPDFSMCILHQKLQQLTRCIRIMASRRERKRIDDKKHSDVYTEEVTGEWTDGWEDWEDITYDLSNESFADEIDLACNNDTNEHAGEIMEDLGTEEDCEPIGILREDPLLKLLLKPDHPLRIPICQPQIVYTSDEIGMQDELSSQTTSLQRGHRIRKDSHHAALSSDMSSFKAANPGCIFEDFIRWYSPKDWNASETINRGELSQRMKSTNNTWRKLWRSAPILCADRQIPLFDAHAIGEQILSELEHYDPAQLFQQLISVALGNVLCCLGRTTSCTELSLPIVHDAIRRLHGYMKAARLPMDAFDEFAQAEILCARATSLLYCLPTSGRLIAALMKSEIALITSTSERNEVTKLFAPEGRSFPPKQLAEYVMYSSQNKDSLIGNRVYISMKFDNVSTMGMSFMARSASEDHNTSNTHRHTHSNSSTDTTLSLSALAILSARRLKRVAARAAHAAKIRATRNSKLDPTFKIALAFDSNTCTISTNNLIPT